MNYHISTTILLGLILALLPHVDGLVGMSTDWDSRLKVRTLPAYAYPQAGQLIAERYQWHYYRSSSALLATPVDSAPTTLVDAVTAACKSSNGCADLPFINPELCRSCGIAISSKIQVSTHILETIGDSSYNDIAVQWEKLAKQELQNVGCQITRTSMLSSNSVIVNWNVSFVPYSIRSLATIGSLVPGVRTSFYNILDRERLAITFSWGALFKFFSQLLLTGELRLPIAVILGSSQFTFNDTHSGIASPSDTTRWTLTKYNERIDLVSSLNSGHLKNRRLATDLLEFLDARRPSSIGLNAWNDLLVDKIKVQSVPGMRQFDIDGLEGEQQTQLLSASNRLLGYFTGIVLLFGLCFGLVVMQNVMSYRHSGSAAAGQTAAAMYDDTSMMDYF